MKHYIRKLWFYTFMCGMLVLTTITTTYAYYAINYVNEQEEFEFDIESGDELLISTDGINFKKETPEALKIKGSGVRVIIPILLRYSFIFSKQNIIPCFDIKTGANFIISVHYLMSGIKSGINWMVSII